MINTLIMNAKNVTQLLIEAVKLLFIIDIAFVIIWISLLFIICMVKLLISIIKGDTTSEVASISKVDDEYFNKDHDE